jgi:thymidylate kinase
METALHPLLEAAFRGLEQTGVRWCLLRLPSNPAAPKGDVDLLVDRADLGRLRQALEPLDFVQLSAWSHVPDIVFLGYDRTTDLWIKLHIVTDLSFGPFHVLQTGAEADCLARRRRDGDMVVLAPDDAFWALLLHCMLDKRTIAARHRTTLQTLVQAGCTDGPLAQAVEESCPDGWNTELVLACVRQSDWAALEGVAPSLARAWGSRHLGSVYRRTFGHAGGRLVAKLLGLLRRRGPTVALLGPDGAGKSTLAAGIEQSFYFPVRSVYMGLGDHHLPRLARVRVPGLGHPALPLVTWARYLKAQYYRTGQRLVIFDRYVYDALLPPARNNWLKQRLRQMLARACPAPDLVLLLDAPSDTMYERKGEFSTTHLEAHRQHYLALQQRIPQLQIVDATRPRDTVRSDVVGRIWHHYVARWRQH